MSTRLLIVDDDVGLCRGLADILTDAGYCVETANDGVAGLEMIEKDAFDVILLDIKMPGMNGIELLRQLRGHPPKGRIFIVSGAPNAEELLSAGEVHDMTSGVIHKPFDVSSLERIIGGLT